MRTYDTTDSTAPLARNYLVRFASMRPRRAMKPHASSQPARVLTTRSRRTYCEAAAQPNSLGSGAPQIKVSK